MEGFQGSDLDLVTLLPPTFYGLELSYVTTAAWETGNEVQRALRELGNGLMSLPRTPQEQSYLHLIFIYP